MSPAATVELLPRPLDPEGRWWARVLAYEVDGELLPVSVEVRLKPAPCAHDVEPDDQPPEIMWERQPCTCPFPEPWPGVECVPPGGLPVRLLRNLRLQDFVEDWRQSGRNAERLGLLDHPVADVAEHLRAMAAKAHQPVKGRGRPRSEPAVHLRRLAALDEATAAGGGQTAAARKVGISEQALRGSVAWARQQQPPLWTSPGRGRAGRPTPYGRAVLEQLDSNAEEKGRAR